jgi:hypothetical protein
MYSPGSIVYFTPFYFSDGSIPKPKYLLILKEKIDGDNILAILTTKLDSVPDFVPKKHGCIDNPEINFNCYYLKKGQIITKNGWGFPKDTFVYGFRLALFSLSDLYGKYKIEDADYQIIGELLDSEYKAIISCMRNSPSVKRKYRRSLGADI